MPNIELWNKYPEGHWLRDYGLTEVIIIDDEINNENALMIPPDKRNQLKGRLNCRFAFYGQDVQKKWDILWFKNELSRIKEECKRPAIIFLDLMYGSKQKTPEEGSGINFLEILKEVRKEDEYFSGIPIIIHTAGQQSDPLVQKLKDSGSCQGFLEKGYNADQLEAVLLDFALLSDPDIHAYSKTMRAVAEKLRKIVLDPNLKETIENRPTDIPLTTLLIGNSGDGKNFLAKHLISMSSRKNQPQGEMDFSVIHDKNEAVIRMFGQLPFTDHVGHYFNLNIESGKIVGVPLITKPKTLSENHILLAQIGLTTYLDGGTIILNELGNSPQEMQQTLLTFLDKRIIQPRHYNSFLPTKRYYDLWVIVTMQPQHSFADLGTRRDYMQQINIPPLKYRADDAIPLAISVLDNEMTKKPEDLFRPAALGWLKDSVGDISIRSFRGMINNLRFESAIQPFNVDELESAYKKINNSPSHDTPKTSAQMDLRGSQTLTAQTAAYSEVSSYAAEIIYRPNMLDGLKTALKEKSRECVRNIADYTLWAIEQRKQNNTNPSYTGAWLFMTGEEKSNKCAEVQRAIGDFIFDGLTDEEIIERVKDSELLKNAVLTCGGQRNKKERLDRLNSIRKALGANSGKGN